MHSNSMIMVFLVLSSACVGQHTGSNKDTHYCSARELDTLKLIFQKLEGSCQTKVTNLNASVNEISKSEASLSRDFQEQANILRNMQREMSGLKQEIADLKTKSNGQHCVHNYVPATGGSGGGYFTDWNSFVSSGFAKITKLTIRSGSRIDCFGLTYGNYAGGCHGGSGGTFRSFNLDSDEYITRISGKSGDEVFQMKITTNKRAFGPYGGSGGGRFTEFSMYSGGKQLAFISGRSGRRLDKLQLHFNC